MIDNFTIDKKSKLFQKFMQNKHKNAQNSSSTVSLTTDRPSVQHSQKDCQQTNHIIGGFMRQEKRRDQLESQFIDQNENYDNLMNMGGRKQSKTTKHDINDLNNSRNQGISNMLKDVLRKAREVRNKNQTQTISKDVGKLLSSEQFIKTNANLQQNNMNKNINQRDTMVTAKQNSNQQLGIEVNQQSQSLLQESKLINFDNNQMKEQTKIMSDDEQHFETNLEDSLQNYRDKQQQKYLQQIAQLKQKVSKLRSNQDVLIRQNMKLKQQVQNQVRLKSKYQEMSRQMSFKNKQLQGLLDNKDINLKRKNDQVSSWKNQYQIAKEQLAIVTLQIQTLKNRCSFAESENIIMRKQAKDKDELIQELQNKISQQNEENKLAKQYLCSLTLKLFYAEQQIQKITGRSLKKDINAQIYSESSITMSQRVKINSSQTNVIEKDCIDQRVNRKREFARERSITMKSQRINKSQQFQKQINHTSAQKSKQKAQIKQVHVFQKHDDSLKCQRIDELQKQLADLIQLKVFNGKTRLRRIQIQRQLQQLYQTH